MHGLPDDAKFLTEEERVQVKERLALDRANMNTKFSYAFVWQGLKDWKSYYFAVIYVGNAISVYALSLFIPTIITGLGWKAADAQLLSTPPYILAMLMALLMARLSDKFQMRGPFILASQLLAIIGYAVLRGTTKPKYGYLALFFCASGVYSTVPLLISWASNNTGGDTKKAVRIALMVGLGNLGGICSSFVYRYVLLLSPALYLLDDLLTLISGAINRNKDKPRYHLGHTVCLSMLCMSWSLVALYVFIFHRLNKAKERKCQEEHITEERAAEYMDLGDDSPLFRYSL